MISIDRWIICVTARPLQPDILHCLHGMQRDF